MPSLKILNLLIIALASYAYLNIEAQTTTGTANSREIASSKSSLPPSIKIANGQSASRGKPIDGGMNNSDDKLPPPKSTGTGSDKGKPKPATIPPTIPGTSSGGTGGTTSGGKSNAKALRARAALESILNKRNNGVAPPPNTVNTGMPSTVRPVVGSGSGSGCPNNKSGGAKIVLGGSGAAKTVPPGSVMPSSKDPSLGKRQPEASTTSTPPPPEKPETQGSSFLDRVSKMGKAGTIDPAIHEKFKAYLSNKFSSSGATKKPESTDVSAKEKPLNKRHDQTSPPTAQATELVDCNASGMKPIILGQKLILVAGKPEATPGQQADMVSNPMELQAKDKNVRKRQLEGLGGGLGGLGGGGGGILSKIKGMKGMGGLGGKSS